MWKRTGAMLASLCMMVAHAAAVELNQATVVDLDGMAGIGPTLSRRILEAHRQAPFKDWRDFMARVKGVKSKTAHKLSAAGLTINGQRFNGQSRCAQGAFQELQYMHPEESYNNSVRMSTTVPAPCATDPLGASSAKTIRRDAAP